MASSSGTPGTLGGGSRERVSGGERESLAGTLTLGPEDDRPASHRVTSSYTGIKTSTPAGSKIGSMEDITSSRHSSRNYPDETSDQTHNQHSSFEVMNVDIDNLDKSGFSNGEGLDSSHDDLDLLSPRIHASGYSVPDLTSGLMSATRHRHHGGSHRTSRDYRKPGASLSSSRGASPDANQIIGGSRKKAASAEVSKFLVEKEVLESQLRKLQVENSTLQTENKLLKEKHNRGQARITELENKLKGVRQDAVTLGAEIGDDLSAMTRRARDRSDQEVRDLQHRVNDLSAQLDIIHTENIALKKQIEHSRWPAENSQTTKSSGRSRIIESFKVENLCLKDEIRQAKRLLDESERARTEEAERRKEATLQVVRLTEMKALLNQQLEQAGGGSVAERQVKSLERRLKITEERLHQERSDRANKLSDMEEKLITENARLQVLEKELKRQLTREREKHKNLEQKHKDIRDESERLRVQLAETNSVSENSGLMKLRTGQRKVIRDERGMLEDRITRYKDTLEDVSKEKEELESVLHVKIKELTQAHHNAVAEARNLEDMNAAITAENESLRSSLKYPGTPTPCVRDTQVSSVEAHIESLRNQLRTLETESAHKSRNERLLESELGSIRTQLTAKDAALDEALSEIDRLNAGHLDGGDLLDVKQRQIEKLTAEVQVLQREVNQLSDKLNTANTERSQLEDQVKELNQFKLKSKLTDDSSSRMAESDKLALETELHEKDNQVLKLSIQYNECENEVQRTKQQLAASQRQAEQLELQLDQLQAQLRQKTRQLERMASIEGDHLAQIKALRENLTSANSELSEKTAKMRQLQIEHEQVNTKLQRLDSNAPGSSLKVSPGTSVDAQQRLLEYERENARRDLDRANAAMNIIIQENSELLGRIRELRQELVKERAQLCQVTSDKVETEQQLHLCRDDRDTLLTQKDRLQSDINRLAAGIKGDISQMESEVLPSKVNYEHIYQTLNANGKKMAVELGTVHRLLEARAVESQLFKDTIQRQKTELQSFNRRIEILSEEQLSSRDNIERLTSDLTQKMRENAAALESSQSLAAEKTRLQMEKLQLEKDVGQGGSEMDRRLTELQDLTSKLDKADSRYRDAERQLHQKETALVGFETELKHVNRNNNKLESERAHLQAQLDRSNSEVRQLTSQISMLEQQLAQEKNLAWRKLSEEKAGRDLLNQDRAEALRQVESLRRQAEVATSNLEMERRNLQNLQSTLQQQEDKVFTLEDASKNQRLEIDTLKSHLLENRNTIDQYKKDKQTLYQDVQELCRKLEEKDDALARLQEKCTDAVDHLQKDFTSEKAWMTKEREALELDLAKTKEELAELTEKMRTKELQLDSYVRTSHDLQLERQARQDVETQVNKLEAELTEARNTLSTLQIDSSRKSDQNKYAQENFEKAQLQINQLKEKLKTQREQYSSEITELQCKLTKETHENEMDRSSLQEKLNEALANLRTKEVTLSSLTEAKTTLYESSRGLEKTVESLHGQLHEEITARKLAEQKNESFKTQMEDLRSKRSSAEERHVELQATLSKVEAELNLEKDKCRRLKQEFSDEKSTSSNAEAHVLALHTQVNELKAEVSSLHSQLETQKQSLLGKNKRIALDMKQQMENFDQERSKLVIQAQQLSSDLEAVREQVATKNREQLKLQEDVLSLEEKLRESASKNKHVTDLLNMEEQHRQKLEARNQELELKLRLRSDCDSESSKFDATRAEMGKMIADMQRKLKEQMEQNQSLDKEAVARHHKHLEEYKKKVAALESALNQEQAMHIVTKTQLSSLDEDNQRLRQQLQAARKRTSPATEEKSKSRMEEINEIIARSQTRAQQMLASGAYSDDPLRSSGRELLSPIPMLHHLNTSILSDNRSVASDDLSRDISKDFTTTPDHGIFRPSNVTKKP